MNTELYNIIYTWANEIITAEEFKEAMYNYTRRKDDE